MEHKLLVGIILSSALGLYAQAVPPAAPAAQQPATAQPPATGQPPKPSQSPPTSQPPATGQPSRPGQPPATTGQPLKLKFVKQKYGPYAEELNYVLQRMEGHFIRGYGDRSREASVRVFPEAIIEASSFLADDNATMDRINLVSDLIEGFESPHGMELLTTVHWILREDSNATIDAELAVRLVHTWNARKQKIFPPVHILAAHARLVEKGWG